MLTIAVWIGVGIVIAMVVLWVLKFYWLTIHAGSRDKEPEPCAYCSLMRGHLKTCHDFSLRG
jgi:hypothetical protein